MDHRVGLTRTYQLNSNKGPIELQRLYDVIVCIYSDNDWEIISGEPVEGLTEIELAEVVGLIDDADSNPFLGAVKIEGKRKDFTDEAFHHVEIFGIMPCQLPIDGITSDEFTALGEIYESIKGYCRRGESFIYCDPEGEVSWKYKDITKDVVLAPERVINEMEVASCL